MASPRQRALVTSAKRLTSVHLSRGAALCLAEASDAVGVSQDYLNRCFRAIDGRTYGARLRTARVLRAARLIRAGVKVLDAALAVGYADSRGLQRAFRQRTGMPPSRSSVGVLVRDQPDG